MQELRGFNTGGTAEKRLRPEIQSLYFGIFLRDKLKKESISEADAVLARAGASEILYGEQREPGM